jgi:hypothetical protein
VIQYKNPLKKELTPSSFNKILQLDDGFQLAVDVRPNRTDCPE